MDPGTFKLRQIAAGFNHEPHGLLQNQKLLHIVKPISQYAHDWMHGMLVHGVWNSVLYLLLVAVSKEGVDIWGYLAQYMQTWTWPHHIGSQSTLGELFEPKKKKSHCDAKYFKCDASAGLTMYSVIAFFVMAVLVPAK